MTEAAKSAEEIEDVLASIRRLVAGPGARTAVATPTEGGYKLVLTPSLRVSDPDDPWVPIAPTAEDEAAAADDPDAADEAAWALADRLTDPDEIADSAEEAVSDAIAEGLAADAPWPERDHPGFRAKLTHLQNATAGAEFEAEAGDADWPDAGADHALRELVHLRAQPEPEVVPEPAIAPDAAPMDELPSSDDATAVSAPEWADAAQDLPTQDTAAGTDAEAEAGDAMDTMPDAPQHGADDETSWSEAADDLMQDDEDTVEDLGEAASPFSFPEAEDGILDEETLREIVSEVVRQELQGALGQRITRNVRKMVRREIRLALAAQELE